MDLWDGVVAAQEDVGQYGAGVDNPLSIAHGLGVSCERTRHVGGVVGVSHAPVDVGEPVPSRHERDKSGVFLVSDVAADLIGKHWQRDDNIHLLFLDDVLDIRMQQGTSCSINTNIDNL